jgi:transposase
MMGQQGDGQSQFFYAFNLDEVVPPDHLVRQIDAVLDLSWLHNELARYYSHTGRPSIDPVLMIRMLIVGYVFAIRSERRICSEVQVNLAYRWFCKLGIEDKIPDHSVFCRARHERFHESDASSAFGQVISWSPGTRFFLSTSALIRLASIENPSPPTSPAAMHIATTPSNTRRKASHAVR